MTLRPGTKVDRYVVEDVIGRGAMGCVYSARDTRLGRRVALKVLLPELGEGAQGAEAAARLRREAMVIAAFEHPNAVQVFDLGEHEGCPYLAMELVEGQSLRAWVDHPAAPPWQVLLRWLCDAARALSAAHRAGIVHRDVKPDNILVRRDGAVKVLDFGIAQASGEQAMRRLTLAGRVVGTPAYMSPEQLLDRPVDGRSDQFSWGVTAYEMLSRSLPWGQPKDIGELMVRVAGPEEVAAIPDPSGTLPRAVKDAVLRALRKVPAARFPSMDQLIQALEPWVAGAAVPAPVPAPVPARAAAPAAASAPAPAAARSPGLGGTARLPVVAAVTSPSPAAPAARRSWRRVGLGFALGSLSAIAAGVALFVLAPPRPEPPAAAQAAQAPTAVTDLPRPAAKPEAVAAYVAGLQSMRDGSGEGATRRFEEAVARDPDLAAAHLRLAFSKVGPRPVEAREHLRRAADLRPLLGERDEALLDAIEPLLLRQPADFAEASRRLAAALARYPGDAELALYHAMTIPDLEAATAALDRALDLDPRFALALWLKGQRLAYLGRQGEALAALERCLEVSPRANECREGRIWIDQEDGRCARVAEDARAMTAVSPENPAAWRYLASALVATEAPRESVEEALGKRRDRLPEAERKEAELADGARLAVLRGDFEAAERMARELTAVVAPRALAEDHARPARLLVEILKETDRPADAAEVADDFLKRRDAWEQDGRAEDFAMAKDPTAVMLRALHRAGRISRGELEERRDAWLRAWEARAAPVSRNYLWLHHHAAIVETAEDARAALLALPRFTPLPRFRPFTPADAWIGATYWLGGRVDEAIPALRRATGSCLALDHPVAHTRAHLHLGQALEAKGDRAGACAALAVVRSRWGKARPRSVSAAAADVRRRALGCGG